MGQLEKPYATLGQHLKTVREQASRTLAEVSGAVEIEESQLKLIEAGLRRPDEDVMLLLISYYNMADQEAMHLWELAQYDSDLAEHLQLEQVNESEEKEIMSQLLAKPMIMLMSVDVRTMYSDGAEVSWNEAGITLNFTQATNQPADRPQKLSISKVGMSYQQAEKVLNSLQRALLEVKYTGPRKLLPPNAS